MTATTRILMQQRWTQVVTAFGIVLLGLLLTVAVTESHFGTTSSRQDALTETRIVRSLSGHGLVVSLLDDEIHHPLLQVTGRVLRVNKVEIELYTYASVAARIADEQRWNEQVMGLATRQAGNDLPRATSVRNVLLLIYSDNAELVQAITQAISGLSATS